MISKETITQRQKIDYIVLLRAVAIILVVFAHATRSVHSPNPHMYSPLITPWWEIAIKDYIYSFHMPLLFWISGFVFYFSAVENKKRDTVSNQLLSKAKRLILPMYSVSFLILLPCIFFFGHINGSIVSQIKLFLLGSDNDHLWFLKTLFIIFLVTVPLHYCNKSESKFFYTIVLVIWSFFYVYQRIMPSLMVSAIKYFPFFIIGCFSRKYEYILDKMNFSMMFTFFLFLHILVLFTKRISITHIPKDFIWYFAAFCGTYFMYFFARVAVNYLVSNKIWLLIKKIDTTSFSIYLFHVVFLYIVLFIDFRWGFRIAALRITLSFIAGLLLSIFVHELITKNKILSQAFAIPYYRQDDILRRFN